MNIVEQQIAITKILKSTLPLEFEFIESIKDVYTFAGSFYNNLKFKIILKKDWVEKNFSKDSMEYVNDDFEIDGYSLLSPFTAEEYSNEKINTMDVERYAIRVISFLGVNTNKMSITISYIIE